MSVHTQNVGNVGITSSGGIAVATTASGAVGWLNENAVIIGLTLSLVSLLVGIYFKIRSERKNRDIVERHHQEALQLQREQMQAELTQNAQAHEALRIELIKVMSHRPSE